MSHLRAMAAPTALIDPAGERRRRVDRRGTAHPLGQDLGAAMAGDGIEILFQPQFAAASGEVTGAEALARWPHPQRGVIGGEELFRIAGRSDKARALSDHVMTRALGSAAAWRPDIHLSINITATDLVTPVFPDLVAKALRATGFAPERLVLEITEQALVHDLEGSAATLRKLVDLGVRVALDDFGAGFCNFRYLKMLPLHYLKLDRSMVEGITEDRRDLEVLRGIVALAAALDLKVVAEGVETEGQRAAVVREGCHSWQGFLGARPQPASALAAL